MVNAQHIHCIGIGGIGVSALARIFHAAGKNVSGSDMNQSELTDTLKKEGITVTIGHDANNIPAETDLCIISPAIPPKNVELQAAKEKGIRVITYPEALGEISQEKYTIAIAGTHGKSTTTGLLASVLLHAEKDPTIVIGTTISELSGTNARLGKSDLFLVEACEYHGSFLNLQPNILILTNIEHDHFDDYPTKESYFGVYRDLVNRMSPDGYIIAHHSVPAEIYEDAQATVIHTSKEDFELSLIGDFNKQNASCAYEAAKRMGVDEQTILKGLQAYKGSWRRLEHKGKIGETDVYDDYAHHPTAIKATLKALKEKHPGGSLCCVFQPHQYSRTLNLIEEFATSFIDADAVIIPNIYRVRDKEEDVAAISTQDLVDEIAKHHKNVRNGEGIECATTYLKENMSNYNVVAILGAGDVTAITEALF